ncbi:hypothetical protein BH09ACT8_BH09ACT8_16370 [soil metagenome]
MGVPTVSRSRQVSCETPGLVPGAAGLMVAGFLTTFLSPLLAVSFATSFGFGIEQAGLMVSGGQAGVAVGAFGSLPLLDRLNRRLAGICSVLVVAACLVATGFADTFGTVLIFQIISGVAAGVAYAAANSALAYARQPERAFSIVTVSWMLVGAATLALGPTMQETWPKAGLYIGIAAAELLCLVFIVRLPDVRHLPKDELGPEELEAELESLDIRRPVVEERPSRLTRLIYPPSLLVLAMLVMNIGNLMIWTFAQKMGEHTGMSAQATSAFLGTSQLIGLVGAGITFAIGTRVGKLVLLIPTVIALAVGNLLVGIASNPTLFIIGFLTVNISYFCMTPLLLTLAAELDTHAGRLVVIVGGVSLVAGAIAPALGAFIAGQDRSWPRLGVTALCLGLLAIPLLIHPVRSAVKRAELEAALDDAAQISEPDHSRYPRGETT